MTPAQAARTPFDVSAFRARFPALERELDGRRLVYLDNACTVLKPLDVARATERFYRELGACGGKRSTHLLAQLVEEAAHQARGAAARFLNAESLNEIVFTSGVTEAANLIARAFPYDDRRREVILTDLEHNAVFLPFYEAHQRGEIELKFVRSRNGRVTAADFEPLITERTALIAVTHASNVTGGAQPLGEVLRLARSKGARSFVDDAQYVASHREDVQALQADFVAFSAHKIGGPFGLGVLFGKEQELNRLRHYKVGGGSVKAVRWDGELPEVEYLDAPMRLEPGVANFAALPGLTAALSVLESLPSAARREHAAALVRRAVDGLSRVDRLSIVGEAAALADGSLVSFYSTDPEFSAPDFNLYLNHELDGRFVALRAGEHCAHLLHRALGLEATLRASFFAYNTPGEVDVLVDAVASYAREVSS